MVDPLMRAVVPVYALYHCADIAQSIQHDVDIPHIRQIIYGHCLIRHNGRCKNCERCILGTTDLYFPYDRISPLNYELIPYNTSLLIYSKGSRLYLPIDKRHYSTYYIICTSKSCVT